MTSYGSANESSVAEALATTAALASSSSSPRSANFLNDSRFKAHSSATPSAIVSSSAYTVMSQSPPTQLHQGDSPPWGRQHSLDSKEDNNVGLGLGLNVGMATGMGIGPPLQLDNANDADWDSQSDGREKADTTPENVKKIDEAIFLEEKSKREAMTAADQSFHRYRDLATVQRDPDGQNAASTLSDFQLTPPNRELMPRTDEGCDASPDVSADASAPASVSTNLDLNEEPNLANNNSSSSGSSNNNTNKLSLAFTIDNFIENGSDAATKAAKYKNMMERFQNRHRRSSKTEGNAGGISDAGSASAEADGYSGPESSASSSVMTRSMTAKSSPLAAVTETAKVNLRPRDRSATRLRDKSKRHSWSPRSSTTEPQTPQPSGAEKRSKDKELTAATAAAAASGSSSGAAAREKPPSSASAAAAARAPANLMASRSQFTPRSTAMQMALQKVDLKCPQPPLHDYKPARNKTNTTGGGKNDVDDVDDDEDDISETGTYTIYGDNYTEEEKNLMNIDRSNRGHRDRDGGGGGGAMIHAKHRRPKVLQLMLNSNDTDTTKKTAHHQMRNTTRIPIRAQNVLEVNYYHDGSDEEEEELEDVPVQRASDGDGQGRRCQTADTLLPSVENYYAQVKSRVLKNIAESCGSHSRGKDQSQRQQEDDDDDDDDKGCFTSVTTSGVLAKQSALDPRPKMNRCSSLSTSQIDASEYISGSEAKLKRAAAAAASSYAKGGLTDSQKSDYGLNMFMQQIDSTSAPMPVAPETLALKTARTKNDWIKEWARNVRARSLANDSGGGKHHHSGGGGGDLMTRSYTCSDTNTNSDLLLDVGGSGGASGYGKTRCVASPQINRSLADRFRSSAAAAALHNHGGEDSDYASSDPVLCSSCAKRQVEVCVAGCKPPKSPSKIPSPLHSIGRARSASRSRASLQNVLAPDGNGSGVDIYLQKTAAAINSLQQSLTLKNALNSPTSLDSHCQYRPHHSSPQHHRRNSSSGDAAAAVGVVDHSAALMTSSINEAQLQLLTSGEYLMKRLLMRKNSLDGDRDGAGIGVGVGEGERMILQSPGGERRSLAQRGRVQQQLSPVCRSSSFSSKHHASGGVGAGYHHHAQKKYHGICSPPSLSGSQGHVHGHGQGQQQQLTFSLPLSSSGIAKSASSNNFVQGLYSDYDDNVQYYINDEDDIGYGFYTSDDDDDDEDADDDKYCPRQYDQASGASAVMEDCSSSARSVRVEKTTPPLSNTRYNKALMMRIERSRQKIAPATAAVVNQSRRLASGTSSPSTATPEFPHRMVKSASRSGVGCGGLSRQSVPRDSSLSRLAAHIPNSLASAKKQLLKTAADPVGAGASGVGAGGMPPKAGQQRVQPKYMDISKYKRAQGNSFLRKDESKSTLLKRAAAAAADPIKRSPSTSGLNRTDPARASNRSAKSSMSSSMTQSLTSAGRPSSSGTRQSTPVAVSKQKEVEMAMWKRRSTYDPMKAAAEDRRKKEEAKRMAGSRHSEEMFGDGGVVAGPLLLGGGGGGEVIITESNATDSNNGPNAT